LTQLNSEQDKQKAKAGKYNQRKGLIMRFLYESGLINTYTPIIPLNTADFTFTNLESASLGTADLASVASKIIGLESADLKNKTVNLEGANLNSANLINANLINANLNSADLRLANLNSADLRLANLNSADLSYANLQSNLISANLISANLISANLDGAYLNSANLSYANLSYANLQYANLISANLNSANLNSANLNNTENLTNKQIKLACFWEKAIYTESVKTSRFELIEWSVKDPKANQRKIDKIRQDKASDPPKPPDCSKWKQNPFLK